MYIHAPLHRSTALWQETSANLRRVRHKGCAERNGATVYMQHSNPTNTHTQEDLIS
jgi:hypothetical protein